MPKRSLPNNPSLEHLRKEAKRLRAAWAAREPDAVAQVQELHPRVKGMARLALADAQLVTARSYGFPSWTRLKRHLAEIAPFLWSPPAAPEDPNALAEVFVRLACLTYGNWHRSNPARARRLLAEHPELATADVYCAAASGDAAAVRDAIESDPALANAKGGPLRWEPLLYACYSRMDGAEPGRSTVEVVRLLLAHGADPNAGFLWDGTYVFTALTGAFGEGEDGPNQPPHPHCEAVARLLLDAGADPNDAQTLYNRHFKANDDHLRLLLSYGLGRDVGGPWFGRLGPRAVAPPQLLVEELWAAAKNGFPARVSLLIEHGADVDGRSLRNGRTPYEEALRAGHVAIAEDLLAHGATQIALEREEVFSLACIAGRRAEALALLADDPGVLDRLGPRRRVELIHRAVDANSLDGVRLIVELGVDVDGMVPGTGLDRSPLHDAAIKGSVEMVELLLRLGADPGLRDATYHATPIAWANHGDKRRAVELLLPLAGIHDAVQCGGVERVAELLQRDPSLANASDAYGHPAVFHLHPEMPRLEETIEMLVRHGADLNAADEKGRTLLDRALAQGATEFAAVLRAHGVTPGSGAGPG